MDPYAKAFTLRVWAISIKILKLRETNFKQNRLKNDIFLEKFKWIDYNT